MSIFLELFFALDNMPAVIDYYRTLSITRAASSDEIKRAYRRLALKVNSSHYE